MNIHLTSFGEIENVLDMLVVQRETLVLSTLHEHSNILLVKLNSKPGNYVKLETRNFTFKGHHRSSSLCIFGGLVVNNFNAISDSMVQEYVQNIICMSHQSSFVHRNIYASSSMLWLVFYAHREYVDFLHIEYTVSVTSCDFITINACDSDINEFLHGNYEALFYKKFLEREKQTRCRIVEVVSKDADTMEPRTFCRTVIATGHIFPTRIVDYSITGFFSSFYQGNLSTERFDPRK